MLVDGLSDGVLRDKCEVFLSQQWAGQVLYMDTSLRCRGERVVFGKMELQQGPHGANLSGVEGFSFGAPTTAANALRIVRGLQVRNCSLYCYITFIIALLYYHSAAFKYSTIRNHINLYTSTCHFDLSSI